MREIPELTSRLNDVDARVLNLNEINEDATSANLPAIHIHVAGNLIIQRPDNAQ